MAAPTSTNEVTARKLSSSISALWAKIKSTFQPVADRVTSIRASSSATDTNYPSEKAVRTELDAKANDSDVVHKTGTETVSGAKTFSNTSSVFDGKCANDINGVPLSSGYGVFRTELSDPTLEERGIIEETFANQLECLSKEKIVYETSPKGTETWTTLAVSDSTHNLLWGGNVQGAINISKNVDFRITINAPYNCWLNFLYFYASGKGAKFHIKLEKKLNSSGAWSVVSDTAKTNIGWPGHNTIRHSNLTFSSTSSSQYGSIRLTLYVVDTGNIESNPTYQINKFRYYGGYPYKSDPWIVKNGSLGVTNFPKGITSGVAIPISSGGTGATTAIGAEYNILNQVADIETTLNVDRKIALCNQTKSASNGVFRWIKLSNVWTLFKGLLSSESGVNISGTASGLSSTLDVGSGGTGRTSVTSGNYVVGAGTSAMVEKTPKEVGSDVLSHLDTDNGNVVDDDYIVGSYHVNDTTISSTQFVRRTAVKLWNYIKSKLSGSDVNIGGNAATATKATQDSDGSAINTTYKKLAGASKFTEPQWIDDNTRTSYIDLRIGNSFKSLSIGISGAGNLLLKELANGRTNSPNSENSIIYTLQGGTDYFFNGKASTARTADALADDSAYVHKSGSETISGTKIFTASEVNSESSSGTYSGFFVKRTAANDSNHVYRISIEVTDNGSRGLYDYGGNDYDGDETWIIRKTKDGDIRVGKSTDKVYISDKCFDFSGTIGSDANTFYLG